MPLPWSQEGILRECLPFREEGELVSSSQLLNVYFRVPFVWAWRRKRGKRKGGTAAGALALLGTGSPAGQTKRGED